jgi:hypothetical protein
MAEVKVRGLTLAVEMELVTEQCCSCGAVFAMTKEFKRQCLDDPGVNKGKPFYCPAGHQQWYTGEAPAEKLRRENERLRQHQAYLEDRRREAEEAAKRERHRANGYKGHATRITKRAKAGVCPCCKRHFTALERHMATKHPTFTPMPLEVIEGGMAAR